MPNKLPTRLKKSPLLDAVFEIRFSSQMPVSSIFPGILYNKLDGEKVIEQQASAQLPKEMRDADPSLQFAPLIRIKWKEYILLISDRSVAVGCKMPYPGWAKFKNTIVQVTKILKEGGIIKSIQRYSIKYVNLIPFPDLKKQVSSVKLQVTLGRHVLEKEIFHFRIEIKQDGYINAVQIVSSAFVTTEDKTTKQGLIVDVDTICNIENKHFNEFISELENNLDGIHKKNKEIFFEWCLTPETLAFLEPLYD